MSIFTRFPGAVCGAALAFASLPAAKAAETNIAVAANFADVVREVGAVFEKKTGHKTIFSFGATGQLFTQISQGAPFDVYLSADQTTATKAGADGFGVADSQFTYAEGKLVLYSKNKDAVTGEQTLKDAKFQKIAIAAPGAAPYGAAAVETMKKLGIYENLSSRIVEGQNIAQTFQFVETGNAEVGFVALSQIVANNEGSRWIVPGNLHTPIKQDAILLKRGEANVAAKEFLAFLKGAEAAQIKEKYGYGPGL